MAPVMACFHPVRGYLTRGGNVVFSELERDDVVRSLDLSCGQCVGCRLERSRQWAVRIMHEAQMWERNSFVTLTYDEEHLPAGSSLRYRDFQLFMKRVRHWAPGGEVRFFVAGEYGDLGRPHFHACLFNVGFNDCVLFSKRNGVQLFTSKVLSGLWGKGFASVGSLTFQSAAYVARYVMKKVVGDRSEVHYRRVDDDTGVIVDLEPEFCHMSLKPGIGARWYDKFKSDVYPHGRVVVNGVEVSPPKFYDRKFKKEEAGSDVYAGMLLDRELVSRARCSDRSDSRLAVRELVTKARLSQLKRSI